MTAPVTTSSTTPGANPSAGSSALNLNAAQTKDMFLKLLVAQMKNQDPGNVQPPEQMAAQLAQFSSLEQLVSIRDALGAQTAGTSALESTMAGVAALAAVGKTAVMHGDGVDVSPTHTGSVTADIGAGGGHATLHIVDDAGHEVASGDLGVIAGGRQTFDLSKVSPAVPAGTYHARIDVTDAAGKPVQADMLITGRVDAVVPGANGPSVRIGNLVVPFTSLVEVRA